MKKYIKPATEVYEVGIEALMLITSDGTPADPNVPVKSKGIDELELLIIEEEEEG